MKKLEPRIVAPASTPAEGRRLLDAGADELYCGALPEDWIATYGDGDLLSRRQGKASHIGSRGELRELAELGAETGKTVSLTLNSRYSRQQMSSVLDLAFLWESLGGEAVVVSDPGLLLALNQQGSGLRRHLSLLAGVYNTSAVKFFAALGVSRILLPRDLSPEEMGTIARGGTPMEFGVLALNQKCPFIDGMCGFLHALKLTEGVPSLFDYTGDSEGELPIAWVHDPIYEGHGCRIPWRAGERLVGFVDRDDSASPPCAACLLKPFVENGICHFKIAGRGYPVERILDCVRFLREAIQIGFSTDDRTAATRSTRALYEKVFGNPCGARMCYYDTPQRVPR